MSKPKCISNGCTRKALESIHFCNSCLNGMLEHELHIDDLIPELENAVNPVWDRIKEGKYENRS